MPFELIHPAHARDETPSRRNCAYIYPMTVSAVDQLERMLRAAILKKLGPDPSGELGAMSLSDLVIVYANWSTRLVAVHPRTVHVSARLKASAEYAKNRSDVDALAAKIESGLDITPHLSKDIKTRYVPISRRSQNGRRRADLDRLVAEWQIHHLHISAKMKSSGLVERGKPLLFVRFERTDAYLIEVLDHNSWTALSVFETCVREWPSANLFGASISGLRLANPLTQDEITGNRWAGINSLLEVDGTPYMPSGQSLEGTSLHATDISNKLMHLLNFERTYFAEHAEDDKWVAWEEPGTEFFGFRHSITSEFRPIVGLKLT
jgi:hypothetical protein